jgi:hypothetical protein
VVAQDSLALMLSYNSFTDNYHAVRLLIENSKSFIMTARLAF